ncbi:MAG: FAD:protein FMN transferase [Desulfomonile sp.]|nr:FAD:protein FMN transferase [Desulfomonile sp.]
MFVTAFAAVLLASCRTNEPAQPYRMNRLLLGTLVEISLVGDPDKVKPAAAAIFEEMRRVEDLTSFHKPSKLTEINDRAGSGPFAGDPEVMSLIQRGLAYAEKFHGTFDPTVGAVTKLWRFSGDQPPRLPEQSEITEALTKVGWSKVKVDASAGTIDLPVKGMALDLGGIAKGYALERAVSVARSFGVEGALINVGGDMVAMGEKQPGVPWRIGVQHPRRSDAIAAVLDAKDRVVFTSGDYERFFDRDGTRYHHIIDPRTGYPAQGTQSVTIVGQDTLLADALAKAVFILGSGRGLKLVESMGGMDALLIDAGGKTWTSKGAAEVFQLRR